MTRLLIYAGLVLALILGYYAWQEHQREIGRVEVRLEYAEQAKEMDEKRKAISKPIDAQQIRIVEKIKTVTKTITKEVPIYVPSDSCSLPGGFRVLHDSAVNGEVPEPASIPNAAPSSAQDIAATVAENYGTCHLYAARVKGWEDWAKAQMQANE